MLQASTALGYFEFEEELFSTIVERLDVFYRSIGMEGLLYDKQAPSKYEAREDSGHSLLKGRHHMRLHILSIGDPLTNNLLGYLEDIGYKHVRAWKENMLHPFYAFFFDDKDRKDITSEQKDDVITKLDKLTHELVLKYEGSKEMINYFVKEYRRAILPKNPGVECFSDGLTNGAGEGNITFESNNFDLIQIVGTVVESLLLPDHPSYTSYSNYCAYRNPPKIFGLSIFDLDQERVGKLYRAIIGHGESATLVDGDV